MNREKTKINVFGINLKSIIIKVTIFKMLKDYVI